MVNYVYYDVCCEAWYGVDSTTREEQKLESMTPEGGTYDLPTFTGNDALDRFYKWYNTTQT